MIKIIPAVQRLALLLVIAGAPLCLAAQKIVSRPKPIANILVRPADAAKTPAQQRREAAFMMVWSTLNYQYFDKTFNGLDWNKIRIEYMPRVSAAKTDAEVHRLIQEMVARLGSSHFSLIPPEYYADIRKARSQARNRERALTGEAPEEKEKTPEADDDLEDDPYVRYGIGVELKFIGDALIVSSVEQQSTAAAAGIKPGFVIDKINGVEMKALVVKILAALPDAKHIRDLLPSQIVSFFLNGAQDTSVVLTCLDGNDRSTEFKVPRLLLSGQAVSFGERFPMQFLDYRSQSLNASTGYIRFNVFSFQVVDKFCRSLTDFADKKALIIDLRGNLGGIVATLYGLTGMITDRPLTLGTTLLRDQSLAMTIKPKAKHFSGTIILLVNEQTMSAAELFSAGLKETSRAVVVGERTGGQALMAISMVLPTGAVLEYPIANFQTPKGNFLEAKGVEPDFPIVVDRNSLLSGVDAPLRKAEEIAATAPVVWKTDTGIGSADSALPPPPKAAPQGSTASNGRSSTGITLAKQVPVRKTDPKALQVIADFAQAIGGVQGLKKLASYEATGSGSFGELGMGTTVTLRAFREGPDKFALILSSDLLGEVREIYTDKTAIVQSEYSELESPVYKNTEHQHLFQSITNVLDPEYFAWLTYDGAFDDDGRQLQVIEGQTRTGAAIGLSFDPKTKMLVRFTSTGLMYTFDDYRKVDSLLLPFIVKIDGIMDIKLTEIKLDQKIDQEFFQRKEKCFDKALTGTAVPGPSSSR